MSCAADVVSTAKIETCAPAGIADEVSAASVCWAEVGFFSPEASCDGVAVISVVKLPPDAGGPAAKPMAVGSPLGSGDRKN